MTETQDEFNQWVLENEPIFTLTANHAGGEFSADPAAISCAPTTSNWLQPAPAPFGSLSSAPTSAPTSSSTDSAPTSAPASAPDKAALVEQYIASEVYSGDEDFSLTSAIRYDPALYVHHYAANHAVSSSDSATTLVDSSSFSSSPPLPTTAELYERALNELSASIEEKKRVPDECFFLLALHQQRLQFGADFFGWDVEVPLDLLRSELNRAVTASTVDWRLPHKIRALVDKNGTLTLQVAPAPVRPNIFSGLKTNQVPGMDPVYEVYLDSRSIMISPFTSLKTTKRDIYDAARARSLRPGAANPLQEVILYNTRDEVTEGSIFNLALFRDGAWRTPPLGTGCLCGVVRHHLLSKQMVVEDEISIKSLKHGEPVLLFNGVQGVVRGILNLEN